MLQHGRGAENGHSFQLGGVCAPASLGISLALKNKTGKEQNPPIMSKAQLVRLLGQNWRWLPYKGVLSAAGLLHKHLFGFSSVRKAH